MLVASKNKNQKIVWGLLSYTFEQTPTTSELEMMMSDYQTDTSKELYLYKTSDSENFIGLIGIEKHLAQGDDQQAEQIESIVIKHFSLLPSFRSEGEGIRMFSELKQLYPDIAIIGSLETSALVVYYTKQYNEMIERSK